MMTDRRTTGTDSQPESQLDQSCHGAEVCEAMTACPLAAQTRKHRTSSSLKHVPMKWLPPPRGCATCSDDAIEEEFLNGNLTISKLKE
ncbi:unnamed protein product [Soboliphyme baturini]|uniref:Uncharacterized protein n=1 Tax=Soboliphyme baturini TaxID=241478 RepID=A0A183IBC4_9BILA|nr:unnamed protein product [Soboliphyme baturini]